MKLRSEISSIVLVLVVSAGVLPWAFAGEMQESRFPWSVQLAQVDDFDLPPPDFNEGEEAPSSSEESGAGAADFLPPDVRLDEGFTPGGHSVATTSPGETISAPKDPARAVYDEELGGVRGEKETMRKRSKNVDERQFTLWKSQNVEKNKMGVWIHGLGRAFTDSFETFGSAVSFPLRRRSQNAYLDFHLYGTITRQARWETEFRYTAPGIAPALDGFIPRRITLFLQPEWLSAEFGDFDEVYTPLTLWNESTFFFQFAPDFLVRDDFYKKYESFLHNAPKVPLRGVRLSEKWMWPSSKVFEFAALKGFAQLPFDGFNNGGYGLGFSHWTFGGSAEIRVKPGVSLSAQGLLYDEPLDTDQTAVYVPLNPTTWAQRYQVGSLRLGLDIPAGENFAFGGEVEGAGSIFQDDKRTPDRKVKDVALRAGPMFRFRKSTLNVWYLETGELYFSPLAQFRQEDAAGDVVPFPPVNGLLRAGDFFQTYSRLGYNTLPYGLATPNRQGVGGKLRVQAGKQDFLKLSADAYQLKEKSGNLVLDALNTGFQSVDAGTGEPEIRRDFTFVNAGQSVNLAPLWSGEKDVIVGANYRFENTESRLGTLKYTQLLGSIGVQAAKWLKAEIAGLRAKASGVETGWNGALEARYSYLFDNKDLGSYSALATDRKESGVGGSLSFQVTRNSELHVDGTHRWIKDPAQFTGMRQEATARGVYEVAF